MTLNSSVKELTNKLERDPDKGGKHSKHTRN